MKFIFSRIPYLYWSTDRLRKVLRKRRVKNVIKYVSEIAHLLHSRLNYLASKGVHSITCSCSAVRIVETGPSIKTHLHEYQCCRKTHSAVINHQHNTGHKIRSDSISISAKTLFYLPWKMRGSPIGSCLENSRQTHSRIGSQLLTRFQLNDSLQLGNSVSIRKTWYY